MGRKKSIQKGKSNGNVQSGRLAKMVSHDTADLIREFRAVLNQEHRRDSRISDNDVIRIALFECFDARGKVVR